MLGIDFRERPLAPLDIAEQTIELKGQVALAQIRFTLTKRRAAYPLASRPKAVIITASL